MQEQLPRLQGGISPCHPWLFGNCSVHRPPLWWHCSRSRVPDAIYLPHPWGRRSRVPDAIYLPHP
jgi:hypothetical protein